MLNEWHGKSTQPLPVIVFAFLQLNFESLRLLQSGQPLDQRRMAVMQPNGERMGLRVRQMIHP